MNRAAPTLLALLSLALAACHALLPLSSAGRDVSKDDVGVVDGWLDIGTPTDGSTDQYRDQSATPDGPCAWTAFSTPVKVAELSSSYTDWAPHLADNGLTLYFSSDRYPTSGNTDIWVATRASTGATFDAWSSVAELNGTGPDSDPCVSVDGLEVLFTCGGGEICRATRAAKGDAFSPSPPALVQGLAPGGEAGTAGPFLARDGISLYYHLCTAYNDINTCDLALATRTAPGAPFVFVRKLDEVNDPAYLDGWPTVSADGLELFFEAARAGIGLGVFRATRASTSDPFGPATFVSELGAAGDPDLSPDGRTLAVSVGTPADLYLATRACLP